MKCRLVLLVVLTALASQNALAAEILRYNVAPGTKFAFRNTMTVDMSLDLNASGQQMDMEQKINRTMSGTITAIEVDGGKPTLMEVAFDDSCGSAIDTNGTAQEQPFALAGKTVKVTLAGDDMTVEGGGEIDEETRKAVLEIVYLEDSLFPSEPVDVGAEWPGRLTRDESVAQELIFTLEKIEERSGRRIAVLRCRGKIQEDNNGIDMQGEIGGPVYVDMATGLVVESVVEGGLVVDGESSEGGVVVTIKGTGEIGATTGGDILDDGAGGSLISSEDKAAGQRHDGVYEGEGLKMTVSGDKAVLEMNGLVLDGRIESRDGDAFTGSFLYQEERFEFQGAFSSGGATLTSGTKTYNMKRGGVVNPIGSSS